MEKEGRSLASRGQGVFDEDDMVPFSSLPLYLLLYPSQIFEKLISLHSRPFSTLP